MAKLGHAAGRGQLAVTTDLSFALALLGSCIKVPPFLVAKQAAVGQPFSCSVSLLKDSHSTRLYQGTLVAAPITGAEASRLPCMQIITPIITLPAAGLVLLQKEPAIQVLVVKTHRLTAQRQPCLQIIMQQQDDMTRTREMQIQQLEMQGRKRRGRPPGSKNKPKSDVSGGLEIREFFCPAVHVLMGTCLLVRPAQGGQQKC